MATATAMPVQQQMPVATATPMATPVHGAAPMPGAVVQVPMQPVAANGSPPTFQRQPTFNRAMEDIKRIPLKTRVLLGGCFCTFLIFGGFVLVRMNTGCGCPAGYEVEHQDDRSCDCDGGIFNCEYQCYDGRCFKDGSETGCDGWMNNGTSDPEQDVGCAPSGLRSSGIRCPGKASDCDCNDCGSTYCDCDQAYDCSTCCGS